MTYFSALAAREHHRDGSVSRFKPKLIKAGTANAALPPLHSERRSIAPRPKLADACAVEGIEANRRRNPTPQAGLTVGVRTFVQALSSGGGRRRMFALLAVGSSDTRVG